MALYIEEDQVWKCPNHPSRRRRTGICPKCLRQRLLTLCPNCANTLPCNCSPSPANSSSSSSSSSNSFSLFSFSRNGSRHELNNVEVDQTLRKSRSVAISFLRARSRHVGNEVDVKNSNTLPAKVSRSRVGLWPVFVKGKKCDVHNDGGEGEGELAVDNNNSMMMMRSRSVTAGAGAGNGNKPAKQRGWYFPSPVNVFRHSKSHQSVPVA